MANVKSDVTTLIDSLNPSDVKLDPSLYHGRYRVAGFYVNTTATPPAVGETVDLVDLPAGARVWGIYINSDALSSGAGTAGMDIGDTADVDRFVAALNLDAVFNAWVALRIDPNDLASKTLGIGYKYSAKTRVKGTVTGEALAASADITGFVLYTVD